MTAGLLPKFRILALVVPFSLIAPPLGAADDKPAPPQLENTDARVDITPRVSTRPEAKTLIPHANLRIDTQLVLINVTVTDPLNRFVTGLEREHFRIFEDKVEQKVTQFSSEDAPLSVGVVFDTSGSMGSKLQKSRQAVAEFLKAANPQDEFFLVEFSDQPQLVTPFTTDIEQLQNSLTFTESKGQTALLDAIYLAMHEMKKAKTRARPSSSSPTGAITAAVILRVKSRTRYGKRTCRFMPSAFSSRSARAGARRRRWPAPACCSR